MALPEAWKMVPVTATFCYTDGSPVTGQVRFDSARRVVVDGVIVVPSRITATLDQNGSIALELPATNDPELIVATKKTAKRPAKKAAKAPAKRAGGRPTKYQPPYAEQARKLALLGFTDAKMADFFGVAESTLNLWKKRPEFSESLRAGKEDADANVATSLYRAALGGGTVTETVEEPDAEGNIVTKTKVKELPANVTAQIFWLKNRQPHHWRDKVVLEDETPPEVLAETAARYEEIMTRARERQRRILIERGIVPGDGEA